MATTRPCGSCGKPVEQKDRGRPVVYCSGACRVRAHRAARRAQETGVAPEQRPARADSAVPVSAGAARAAELAAALRVAVGALADQAATGERSPDLMATLTAHARSQLGALIRLAVNARTSQHAGAGNEARNASEETTADAPDVATAAKGTDRVRPAPGLGEGYQLGPVDGGRRYLYLHGERIGYTGRSGSRWLAWHLGGRPVVLDSSDASTYPTQGTALAALAAEHRSNPDRATGPASPQAGPAGDRDDLAAVDEQLAAERVAFEHALKPVPEVGDGYQMAPWPGTHRYYLVLGGERIGHAEKVGSKWRAFTTSGAAASRTFTTRRDALAEVARMHQAQDRRPATKSTAGSEPTAARKGQPVTKPATNQVTKSRIGHP